jgi:hypothetical protein
MAAAAVDAYIESAAQWQRDADLVEDLRAANRIARAISDESRAAAAIQNLIDAVENLLTVTPPLPGVVIRALRHAVAEPDCPGDVDQILERAAQALTNSDDRDEVLRLIFGRCADDQCRQEIWRRRVDAYIDRWPVNRSTGQLSASCVNPVSTGIRKGARFPVYAGHLARRPTDILISVIS